jgi:coproporphyrinogen III oxidase-like Fe-S oxidoreductase
VTDTGHALIRLVTRSARRHLVGPRQRWVFERPPEGWAPPAVARTSLYLHVPFCRNACPYCPYTKVPYSEALLEPYTRAALAEVDWWADSVGPAEVTSVYIGGGTPTLALDAVDRVLARVRGRFRVRGDVCIETNPTEVGEETVRQLHDMGIALVSLGVESFQEESLALLGRGYQGPVGERALAMLAEAGFASVNADLMFALPGQSAGDVVADLSRAAELGANQVTTYPLFTFPYTSVGQYRRMRSVAMPDLQVRREHYRAINRWCRQYGFQRVSVWGFKRGPTPRYSSVTRDGYLGIGPGAGSHLPDGFVLNTFDLASWMGALHDGRGAGAVALRLPFVDQMSGWWWLYWRLYDTHVPADALEVALGRDAAKARRWLAAAGIAGMAVATDGHVDLTERGAFWLHLAQNYLALDYVNTLWTAARREPWPRSVAI